MRMASIVTGANTPQSQPYDAKQVKNNAGGYSYEVDKWARLHRFLILGSENGTYYVSPQKLTKQNCSNLDACIKEDGLKTVALIKDVSLRGAAPKQDATIFALARAISIGNLDTRRAAEEAAYEVLRTATMFFQFLEEVKLMRGRGGRIMHRLQQKWYNKRPVDSLAAQIVKYGSRNNWNHRDVLRIAKPKTTDPQRQALYGWVATGEWGWLRRYVKEKGQIIDPGTRDETIAMPRVLEGYIKTREALKNGAKGREVAKIVSDYNLELTMLADAHQAMPEVWKALLVGMKPMALIRNLGNLGKHDILKPLSQELSMVVEKLRNVEELKKARIHPVQALAALYTYSGGKGIRGSGTWNVQGPVVDALNDAFYATFDNVEASGKRFVLGLDISGSMRGTLVNGIPNMKCTTACAAMALVTAAREKNHVFVAFDQSAKQIDISARERLDDVANRIERMANGGTDCAQPILWAMKNKVAADVFVIYTDSETWYGSKHPVQALKEYRKAMGINAKLVVVAMASNGYSIADHDDPLTLSVCGFDTNVPALLSEFCRD